MNADKNQIDALFAIQKLDLECSSLDKAFEELPERTQIAQLRKKREEIQKKAAQIEEVKEQNKVVLRNLRDDEARKLEKQKQAQTDIETTTGNFRFVEEKSKELQILTQKMEVIKSKIEEAELNQLKTEELENQVNTALKQIDEAEAKLIESFKQKGATIQQNKARANAAVEKLKESLPKELYEAFAKAQKHGAGVGIAKLQDSRCGACRTQFEHMRLLDISRNAPVATCPNCKRLLVIERI